MRKVVINKCYGGYGLLKAAEEMVISRGGDPKKRDCNELIWVVENMGAWVNTRYSNLKVVEIPEDVDWQIDEYDGLEWVAEVHRTWD